MSGFDKILIANRGEIAVRIMATARSLGYPTVAVYSAADAGARHVRLADQAVGIGGAAATESYLAIEKIIDAARRSGADAIHPGYGFLSENADFARACQAAGIIFIGPSPEAIDLMANKRRAKIAMLKVDIPCIPGYQGADQSDEKLVIEARSIGYPLMIKAAMGGGGRGLRRVGQSGELEPLLKSARSEARTAFGNDELILEKALIDPRHIEIQIFADGFGNIVYLGERDCSVQRRHQKVIEEAPSPFVDECLRRHMGETAVKAARVGNYCGAGTVEFLVDKAKNFYFLEMNTRLQVEHPVTELITGLDLVAWQLQVAAGEKLPLKQQQITFRGHAIEARLYAEDPRNNFMPQTGKIIRWSPAAGVRVDHGISEGQRVSRHYDPMLAKVIVQGRDRDEARRRLACALADTVLLGINNNKRFLINILRHPAFVAGEVTTDFIRRHFTNDRSLQPAKPSIMSLGMAALLFFSNSAKQAVCSPALAGWRNGAQTPWRYIINCDGEDYPLTLCVDYHENSPIYRINSADQQVELAILDLSRQHCTIINNRVAETVNYVQQGEILYLDGEWGSMRFDDITHAPVSSRDSQGSGRIMASMDGAIVSVLVKVGDQVQKGQPLAILEAMKMEHQLTADADGVVESVTIKTGDQVRARQLLITVQPEAADEG